ncbi:MAG: transcriptional repressor [Clostridia bacterium]|nr:transcriptional repressor [Clostridia bacterium]
MKNYSRQREAILTVLRSTDTHPTASKVYHKVREIIPNISLGTVYRNLAQLKESGEIISVNVGDGFEHFDGNAKPHIHMHCKKCSAIIDVMLNEDVISDAAQKNGFVPENMVLVINGLCKTCNQNDVN